MLDGPAPLQYVLILMNYLCHNAISKLGHILRYRGSNVNIWIFGRAYRSALDVMHPVNRTTRLSASEEEKSRE